MRLTFIHAPYQFKERIRPWDKLKQISSWNTEPWVCMGDSHEVLYHWEKVGKRTADNYRINAFQDFLNACSFMEIDCTYYAFT